MTNLKWIDNLRKTIYNTLDILINQDYCLLDVPNHINIGDQLIWQGEKDYLKRLPFKLQYEASLEYFAFNKMPDSGLILLHGGGNFGDLWESPPAFRRKIIEKYKDRKIIILPQTVFYKNEKNLLRDSEIYNSHPDLTICTRDNESYNIIKKYFTKNKVLLLPDMAFCSDYSSFANNDMGNEILFMERKDQELNSEAVNLLKYMQKKEFPRNITIEDWPTFEKNIKNDNNSLTAKTFNFLKYKIQKILFALQKTSDIIDPVFGFNKNITREKYIADGIEFIKRFDVIYTTRLHGAILSILMGKQVYIIDNSYGKNLNFYNAWLKDFENVSMFNEDKYLNQ